MLSSLVLSVTYRCPVKCKYCGVNAGPHRKERLSLPVIKRLIEEVRSIGLTSLVVFTGGEPLLLGEDLYEAVDFATSKGLATRIVTNAYWATSYDRALEVLTRLQEAGLSEINYSCDDFHQEFIPLDRVKWANEAAAAIGMPALLAVKGLKNSLIDIPYLERFFGVKLAPFHKGRDNPRNNVASYGVTVPVGWECDSITDDELLYSDNEDSWKGACASALERIVITPSGELAICCGIGSDDFPESRIGNIHDESLWTLLTRANEDLIVNWLALEGPYGIMKHIQAADPSIRFRDRYVNNCHLCHDIFTRQDTRDILMKTASSKAPALCISRAWFEEHRAQIFRSDQSTPNN